MNAKKFVLTVCCLLAMNGIATAQGKFPAKAEAVTGKKWVLSSRATPDGNIDEVLVKKGQKVKKSDKIVTLTYVPDLMERGVAQVTAASNILLNAELVLENNRKAKVAVSSQDLARSSYAREKAYADLAVAKANATPFEPVAGISGTVTKIHAVRGQAFTSMGPETVFMEIVDLTVLETTIQVPLENVDDLGIITVSVPKTKLPPIQAMIVSKGFEVTEDGKVAVTIAFDNPNERIRLGQALDVNVEKK